MLKRGVRTLLVAGLGVSLALVVIVLIGSDSPDRNVRAASDSPYGPAPANAGNEAAIRTADGRPAPVSEPRESPRRESAPGLAAPAVGTDYPVAAPGPFDATDADGASSSARGNGASMTAAASDRGRNADRPDDEARPLGWCYRTTLDAGVVSDSTTAWNGSRSALLRAHEGGSLPDLRVSTLGQTVDATAYRGLRIELSAALRGVGGVALLLRAATHSQLERTDNRLPTAPATIAYFILQAGTPWQRLAIVGDVPPDADILSFGVAHNSSTPLWVDGVRITDVGADAPLTQTPQQPPVAVQLDPRWMLAAPTNLDFELTDRESADGQAPGCDARRELYSPTATRRAGAGSSS